MCTYTLHYSLEQEGPGSTASKSALKISPQIFLLEMLWRRRNLNSSDTYYNYYQIIKNFLTVRYKRRPL
jgi:hypothetical protein